MKFSASILGTKKIVQGGCHGCWKTTIEKKRMGAVLKFLERYRRDGDKFLDYIVIGDETWVSHFTPESKRQSIEWHHPRSSSKHRKFKQTLSTRKIMATGFWDRKGVLLVEFLPQGTTINAEPYCTTLRRLR
jgi:predicted phosphohydrolase